MEKLFDLNMLWVWILLFIVFYTILWNNRDFDKGDLSLFRWLLIMISIVITFFSAIVITILPIAKTKIYLLSIPGVFLVFMIDMVNHDDISHFFSKDTLEKLLEYLTIIIVVIVLILFISFLNL